MFGVKKSKGGQGEQEIHPERQLKLKECCDLLVASGYFRARIPSLSPFDKVVGGMSWSMTNSGMDVGIDLFQENLTIGQRIKVAEKMEKTLIRMKCPTVIAAHQIRGLDYDTIFPVMRWLCNKVMQVRAETGDQNRLLSSNQFDKNYALPDEKKPVAAAAYMDGVVESYKPQRKFKTRAGVAFDTAYARAESTLLEYGEKSFRAATDEEKEDIAEAKRGGGGGSKGFDPSKDMKEESKKKAAEEATAAAAAANAARIAELEKQLTAAGGDADLSRSAGQLVGRSAEEIKALITELEAKTKELADESKEGGAGGGGGKRGAAAAFQRQVDALTRKIAAEEKVVVERKTAYDVIQGKLVALQAEVAKKVEYLDRVNSELAKLDALESAAENQEILANLKNLVILNETLKQQEAQFKLHCKAQRDELIDMIKRLEADEGDDEVKRMKEIEAIYNADLAKLNKLRQVLADKNQAIAKIQRDIDEIPTRAELLQFERRFVELYELVAEKLVETRKYFAMYNTLDSSHGYMQKEVNLLDSIVMSFPKAMKTKGGQTNLLQQLNAIVTGVEANKEQCNKDLAEEKTVLSTLADKHNRLLEKQRNYFKAVKSFQEECYKNEKLQALLQDLAPAAS